MFEYDTSFLRFLSNHFSRTQPICPCENYTILTNLVKKIRVRQQSFIQLSSAQYILHQSSSVQLRWFSTHHLHILLLRAETCDLPRAMHLVCPLIVNSLRITRSLIPKLWNGPIANSKNNIRRLSNANQIKLSISSIFSDDKNCIRPSDLFGQKFLEAITYPIRLRVGYSWIDVSFCFDLALCRALNLKIIINA